jgi:hypothetical protein
LIKTSRAKLLVPILDIGIRSLLSRGRCVCLRKLPSRTNAMKVPSVCIQARDLQNESIVCTLLSHIGTTDWHDHSDPDVQS